MSDPTPRNLPSGVVTFLVTDIVGSTEMWEHHPEEMNQALARHDAIIRQAVETFAGQLIKGRGEGDATFSVFRRPTDAVSAARAAQRAFAAEPWPQGARLEVRMAMHTGETLERDGDYFGSPVNRVARLREVADGGQVLLSQSTASLVVDHLPTDCSLREVGTQELRGLARPETMFELVITANVATPDPARVARSRRQARLPTRLAASSIAGFHGRVAELELLRAAWTNALSGRHMVVLLAGEPGIGKTSLAGAFAREIYAQGATVLYGRCDEDLGIPYQPWAEMLKRLMAGATPSELQNLTGRRQAELVALVPSLSTRIGTAATMSAIDVETERHRLFGAVAAAVTEAAATNPILVVLDDLQWADKPTLLMLRHLVSQPEPLPLVILGTYRHHEVSADHPLVDVLAALRREPNVQRVVLGGLTIEDLVGVIEDASGQPLGDPELALAHEVYRETNGNPFFAWELMLHLSETGTVSLSDEGRWVIAQPASEWALPESVREVIGRRAARLGEAVVQTLTTASVIGREFKLDVLAAAVGEDVDIVLEQLERAESAGLIGSLGTGRFSFTHALVAHTLYADHSPTRRARIHRRVAEAYESLGMAEDRVGELAHHWILAGSPDHTGRALEYAMKAAQVATRALAPQEAARWYAESLNLLGTRQHADEHVRCELLIGLGQAQLHSGDPDCLQTLLDAAHLADRLGDSHQLALAVLTGTRGMPGFTNPARVAVLHSAIARMGISDTPERAELLASLAAELSVAGDYEQRRELADEAMAVARRLNDPACLLHVLNHVIPTIGVPSTLAERWELSAEAVALADRLNDPVMAFLARLHRTQAAYESADLAEANACISRMIELAEELQQPTVLWTVAWVRGVQAIVAGRIEEAERLATEALTLGVESGQPDAATIYGGQLFCIRWHQGTDAELVDLLAEMATQRPDLPVLQAGLARLRLEADRRSDIELGPAVVKAVPYDIGWAPAMAFWAEVSSRLGDQESCEVLYDLLSPYGDYVVHVEAVSIGAMSHYLGMLAAALGRPAEAARHFEHAEALHETLEAPFFLARSRLEHGRLLLSAGTESSNYTAGELLRSARDLGEQYGCAGIVRRAAELLATVV